jgi:1-acyl-sn-glycerol-3-phosphate acyltransferase
MRPVESTLNSVLALLLMLGARYLLPLIPENARPGAKRFLTRAGLRLLGVRMTVEGEMIPGPALIVSNHCSYMDILIFQSIAEISFTPKREIESWPIIGGITTAFGAVYVDRSPGRTREITETLLGQLQRGKRICLFPEATTNDGRSMKPFRSSLFALMESWKGATPLPVQPVTLRYESLDGKPLDDTSWPRVAWYGDADLAPHLWRAFGHHNLRVRVIFHEPLVLDEGLGRKDIAQKAEAIIRQTLFASQEIAV